ncbi:carph-isopro domain-containing protein [Reyranella sp.]|uniref:carph-isopro domain-containing protein n=1 Tax=Reyranella sp. TaxID=1929291 RepID=UPI003BAA6FAD
MQTFADIIDAWESPAALADDLGEEVGTVRQWRNRNRLPDRVWKKIVEAARARGIEGVSLDVLAGIAERIAHVGRAASEAASAGQAG